jgi:hypothetical protein
MVWVERSAKNGKRLGMLSPSHRPLAAAGIVIALSLAF